MTTLSQLAQLELELINRARMDPLAEAQRAGLSDLNWLVAPTSSGFPITADPKQVLAGNNQLTAAAVGHTAQMIARNNVSHSGIGDFDPASRIANAGYTSNTVSRPENIGSANANAFNSNPAALPTERQLQQQLAEQTHLRLFKDDPANTSGNEKAGHRLTMLDPSYKEVGIGATMLFTSTPNSVDAKFFMTENFGSRGTQSFLTGAVYNDNVTKDNFYSIGEAIKGVTATVRNASGAVIGSDTTGDGGGWSVGEPGGTYKVTFSAAGKADVSATIEAGSLNAKMDLVNGNEIYANANTTLNEGAVGLRLIGIQNINGTGNAGSNVITGNAGANILTGAGGGDTIDGLGGSDTVVFSGRQSDYKITVNGGSATLQDLRAGSPDGLDTIANIEFVKFFDVTVAYGSLKTTTPPPPVAGSVVISDATVTEGNSSTKVMTFTLTRSGGTAAFDVNYATANGTATAADGDYVAASGAVHFNAGETQKTISITVKGDMKLEGNEAFSVVLSGANNGATIADATGVGTITNDDVNQAPTVTGNNVTVAAKGAIAISSIFAAQDANGDAITKYAFWDAGNGGGHFTINGVAQAAGQWITVNAADLATVRYVGGANGGAETLYATAFDGRAWSGYKSVTATTLNRAAEDFNGDGNSDILFHNNNGSVAMWQMNGMNVIANQGAGTQATSWHAIDAFDFNGDGKADIFWHNDNGQAQLWQMNGATVTQVQNLGAMATNWHVGGVDDFTGDGKAEVLWFSDSNQVQMWTMNGAAHTTENVGTLGTGWNIKDTADYTGDGRADILLQNGNNLAMWQMSGSAVTNNTTFASIGDNFHFAGSGDFNGDGRSDLVFHNDINGQVVLWELQGTNIISNTTVGWTAKGWDIADIGDYNHDGQADLLLQNGTTGAIAEWQMDGNHILATQGLGSVSNDWHLV